MIDPVIHQIWFPFSSAEMPRDWRRFARSWQRWHGDHQYRLWGPEEARAFVAAHHPDFLSTYDAYRLPIQRVDALRVLLLEHFGGIYADLDVECTRSVRPLLEHQQVVLAAEPVRHSQFWRKRGIRQVVSTAFLASERGHPFWREVKEELKRSAAEFEVMESTGPFVFSRCYERSPERLSMTVLAPEHFFPVDDLECRDGSAYDLEQWLARTRTAYGVHHWAASWSREGEAWRPATRVHRRGLPVRVRHPEIHRSSPGTLVARGPLVSCLMVSRGWKEPARWAIECFQRQSYQDRELVVVTSNPEGDLRQHLEALADERIRFGGILPQGMRLGAQRNAAVDLARGELVATWDDDDLSAADRLAAQITALVASGAAASFLERITMWWPARQELLVSSPHHWENTLVALRSALPRYQDLDRGEDAQVVVQLRGKHPHVLVDDPNLYVYTVTGSNSWGPDHFARFTQGATLRAVGLEYERALSLVNKYVPAIEYLDWLQERDPRTFAPSPSAAAQIDAPAPDGAGSPPLTSRIVPSPAAPIQRTDPPLRFLFAWELGGGLGHTVPLSQIARPLLDAGHEVHLALLDLSSAHAGLGQLVRHPGLRIWQAPCWPAALRGHSDSASYAELLYHAGYLEAARLSGLVDGWVSLFRTIRPDLLLADHAPTALLAARGHGLRCAMVGTGFFDPIPGDPMPTFRHWESIPRSRLEEAERTVVATCNAILGARGYPPLVALQDLVAVDEHFLLTVPELDHFERRARDPAQRYYGCLPAASHGRPVAWPRGPEPAVFAYLKGEYDHVDEVMDALKKSPWRVVVFLPGCTPAAMAASTTQRMTVVSDPVDMVEACRGCDAVICHSGSGTTMTALQSGRPLLMLPMYLEQYLVGRRIQSVGAGLALRSEELTLPAFLAALQRVLEQPSFREAAEAFARRHPPPGQNRVAETVAARCQELALEGRTQG